MPKTVILRGIKDFLDQRGLVKEVINNWVKVLIKAQDENITDLLVQNVVIGVQFEVVQESVVQVYFSK
jgi:hypothetical protein